MRLHTEFKCADGRVITVRAFAADVLKMLGIEGKKLPKTALPAQVIQGVKVWVEAAADPVFVNKWGKTRLLKRSTHRVKAQCPQCGWEGSVGRLAQHRCK